MSEKQGWVSKNWKWALPCGCLTMVAGLLCFMALILTFVTGMFKDSVPYQDGLAMAQADPAVIEALGEPIKPGFLPTGSINTSGSTGDCDLSVSLKGAVGGGTLYIVASKQGGEWQFEKLDVVIEASGERIDLLGR